MNNYIPSGTSLFDVLSMVIPGGLILALIVDSLDMQAADCILFSGNRVILYILLMVFSYLMGLVWNMCMDRVFIGFRNNKRGIEFEEKSLHRQKSSLKFFL